MADEEPVDQKIEIEANCKPKCVKTLVEYQVDHATETTQTTPSSFACSKRIAGDETGEKHCTGQYFDYLSCIDKCVARQLFSKLK